MADGVPEKAEGKQDRGENQKIFFVKMVGKEPSKGTENQSRNGECARNNSGLRQGSPDRHGIGRHQGRNHAVTEGGCETDKH